MNSEDKLRESLKNILDEKEFVFNESDWSQAKAVLDAERRKKRMVYYYVLPLVLLIIGLAAYLVKPFKPNELSENTPSKNVANQPTKNTNSERTQNITSPNQEKIDIVNNGTVKGKINSVQKKSDEEQNLEQINTPIQVKNVLNNPTEKKPEIKLIKTPKSIQPIPVSVATIKNKEEQKKKNEISAVVNASSIADINSEQLNKIKEDDEFVIKNETTTHIQNTNQVAISTLSNLNDDKEKTLNSNHIINKTEVDLIPEKTNSVQDVNSVQATKQVANSEAHIPLANDASPETKQNNDVVKPDSLQTPAIAVKDSSKVGDVSKLELSPNNVLFLEAGAIFNGGWKNANIKEAQSISPVFGLFFSGKLISKLNFSFGLQYNNINGLDYSSKTSKITRYGIGKYNKVTVITPYKLHFMTIPVKLNYALNNKNVIGLGYNVAYLLNVDSKVETYTQRLTNVEDYTAYKTAGYTEGFELFNSQIVIFYRRNLYKEIWLNAEFAYGLTDLKDNTFFNANVFERNTGLKLSLVYSIFKK